MHDMRAIFVEILSRLTACPFTKMEACIPVTVIRLTRSRDAAGKLVVRLGVRLLDEYWSSRLAGAGRTRCWPCRRPRSATIFASTRWAGRRQGMVLPAW